MNKIRATILTTAIAGGSIIGLAGVTGIADAATETDAANPTAAALAAPGDGVDDGTRAERRAARRALREANRQEVADVLGVSVEDLAEQLRDGATLADVAEANGVAVDAVVDVIVEQMNERIDLAVENDRITAEEAAEKRLDLEERVQSRVEEGRPEGARGHGHRRHHHRIGHTDVEAPTTDAVESDG